VQVGSLTNWQSIGGTTQGTSFGLKTNGTLWTWGYGFPGTLGQNSTGYISSPVQVGALTTWLSISGGYSSIAAIKTDGTLWAWGRNYNGELGINNIISKSSPTQVGSLTNWATVSSGFYFTVAIKTDGTLWSWGINTNGKLGLNNSNYTYISSPTQIGALTNWAYSAATRTGGFAIKTTGTLWTWGWNVVGTLGLGDTINRSSPVQVGSLTTWLRVSAANYTAGPALRS
jgi:alpha-tubulin suppressor-like RCC1 family protein